MTLTILHPADESVDGMSLSQIDYQITEGAWLGAHAHTSTTPVPPETLRAECEALGNDGEFFPTCYHEE